MKGSDYLDEYKGKPLPDAENLKRCQEMRAIFLAKEWEDRWVLKGRLIKNPHRLLRIARRVVQSQSKGVSR